MLPELKTGGLPRVSVPTTALLPTSVQPPSVFRHPYGHRSIDRRDAAEDPVGVDHDGAVLDRTVDEQRALVDGRCAGYVSSPVNSMMPPPRRVTLAPAALMDMETVKSLAAVPRATLNVKRLAGPRSAGPVNDRRCGRRMRGDSRSVEAAAACRPIERAAGHAEPAVPNDRTAGHIHRAAVNRDGVLPAAVQRAPALVVQRQGRPESTTRAPPM